MFFHIFDNSYWTDTLIDLKLHLYLVLPFSSSDCSNQVTTFKNGWFIELWKLLTSYFLVFQGTTFKDQLLNNHWIEIFDIAFMCPIVVCNSKLLFSEHYLPYLRKYLLLKMRKKLYFWFPSRGTDVTANSTLTVNKGLIPHIKTDGSTCPFQRYNQYHWQRQMAAPAIRRSTLCVCHYELF